MRKTTNKILAFTCLLTGLAASQAVAQTLNNPTHIGRNGSGTSVTYNGATVGGESYTIVGGGADLWDRTDEFTFTYHELAGDFDIKCQVTYLQPTARWSKAGIVAKESLAEDSRRVAQAVSPVGPTENSHPDGGANSMEMLWRTSNFNVNGDNGGNNNLSVATPQYPNAWIRLVREGSKFRGYVGTDGVTWSQTAEQDTATWNGGAMAGKILVGLGVARHPSADDGGGVNRRTRAEFTNYVETVQNFVVGEAMSKTINETYVTFSRPIKQNAAALSVDSYILSGGPEGYGAYTLSVRPGPTPDVMIVTTDDLIEGLAPYVLTVSGVVDTNDVPLAAHGTIQSYIHPGKRGEYALNKIHIRRNQIEGGSTDFFLGSTAYAQGLPTSVYNRPMYDTNTLFEDTMIPTGDQPSGVDRYSTRIVGVLNVPAAGNYGFGLANDDDGRLFLSTTDQLAGKSQIMLRNCCNGARDYPNGGLSPLQALGAGPHLLEYIYSEGGGGNYGAVAWDGGTGTPIANGQSPVPEDAFIPSRFAYNTVFYNLGAPAFLSQPANVTSLVGATATFSVAMDGTPPYQFTWSTNGVPVAGASGSTLNLANVQGTQNGTIVSVCVSNELGGVCSSTATLTVLLNPKLLSASSQGNCHALFLNFNRLMTLGGTYTVVSSNTVDFSLTPITVGSVGYGSSQNQIKLNVSPDLSETNVYLVTISGATSQGDGLLINPDPTTIAVVHGSGYPYAGIANGTPSNLSANQFTNGIISWRTWQGLNQQAGGIPTFMTNPRYLANDPPAERDVTLPAFETPGSENGGTYGGEIKGTWIVPRTATYKFWCAADDQAAIFLSTDNNPATAVAICSEPEWANYRSFANGRNDAGNAARGTPPVNASKTFNLTQGQLVYLQGDYVEGGGGDHLSLAYTTKRVAPSGAQFETLCDVFLAPPLVNVTNYPSLRHTFTAAVDGTPLLAGNANYAYNIQWSSNGVPILGATNATLTTPPLTVANNGDIYSVTASNDFSFTTSASTLTVQERPVVVSASTRNHPRNVYVQFNIPVVLNSANYVLTNSADMFPLALASSAYGSSHSEVVLTAQDNIPINSTIGLAVTGVVAENGGGTLVTDPTYLLFAQGPGSFCPDLTLGLPAGAVLFGTAPAVLNTTDGTVQLTVEANDQAGGLVWGDNNASSMVLDASFDLAMYKTLNADPADGFSFNIAQDLPQDNTSRPYEDGIGSGLRVAFRNYGGNNPGYRIVYNGVTVGYVNRGNRVMATVTSPTPPFKNVRLQITTSGLLSLSWGSDVPFANLQLPNYTGLKGKFGMYARNGGLNHISIVRNICINNYTLGDAAVTVAQTTSTPAECATVSFSATATGSPPFYYQWLRNGTPIVGAIGTSYTPPAISCPADQGVVYSVTVTNLFSTVTGAGTALTVACDAVAPTLVAVGSVNGSKINALFSEAVDATTSLDPMNYRVNGQPAGIEISNIVFLPIEAGRAVTLNLSNSIAGAFTLGVGGVLDACPARNATTSSTNGTVVNTELLSTDVGTLNDPRPPGTNYSFASGQIDITVGGSDFWGNSDHMHFVYTPRLGDFDIKTKVTRLDLQSSWSKAGLDARNDLTTGSPSISTYADPTNGANQVETRLRDTPNGGITDLNGTLGVPRPTAILTPWLRMQRAGDRIVTSVSSNGVNWQVNIDTGTRLCGALPPTLLVGVMTTPNNGNNGNTTTSQLDGFSLTPTGTYAIDGGRVSVTYSEGSVTIGAASLSCNQVLTLRLQGTTELKSDPTQTVWTDIPGTAPVTLPATGPMRFFRAVVVP